MSHFHPIDTITTADVASGPRAKRIESSAGSKLSLIKNSINSLTLHKLLWLEFDWIRRRCAWLDERDPDRCSSAASRQPTERVRCVDRGRYDPGAAATAAGQILSRTGLDGSTLGP